MGVPPLSWTVLAAVVVGVAFGAMACAAGLADGSGHRAHAHGTDTLVASATGSHTGHAVAELVAVGEDAFLESTAPGNDERSGPIGTSVEGHPGMACVVTVDLDVDETVTPVLTERFDALHGTPPVDGVVDLDPPIPRVS